MLVDRALEEVLDRPAGVAVAVESNDPLHLVHPDPTEADLAQPTVEKPGRSLRLVPSSITPKRPLRHSQPLRRLARAQPTAPEPIVDLLEPHRPNLLQQLRPNHLRPSLERF
jgi:hypothetical protein